MVIPAQAGIQKLLRTGFPIRLTLEDSILDEAGIVPVGTLSRE